MPEEIESPVEKLSEELHEAAEHAKENWVRWSALFAALYAVMAATAGLESARYANDAMIEQIKASDQWGYYQAKSLKIMLLESEQNILQQLDKPLPDVSEKLAQYGNEQTEIKAVATELSDASKKHLEKHEVFSRTVTLCQVAIAIIAIAVLTKRRTFSYISGGVWDCWLIFLAARTLGTLSFCVVNDCLD